MAYATINKPTDHFNTKLYTGSNLTQSITGVGFQPDFTWIKNRTSTPSHMLNDVVRTPGKQLNSDNTSAELDRTYFESFDSDGFSLDGNVSDYNQSGSNFVAWNWKAGGTASSNTDGSITSQVSANTTSGFSIVSWTGTGANATVGHGLDQEPDILIIKNRSTSNRWLVYTKLIDGSYDFLELNSTAAKSNSSVTPYTDSVFSVINNVDSGTSGNDYIAYCFAEIKGYSKFGSYTGNGNADGTFVYTGFKPAWVMIKKSSGTDGWSIYDNKREPFNVMDTRISANLSDAEVSGSNIALDFSSNGFKLRGTGTTINTSGQTYIYMAFAEAPLVGTNNIPATAG